MSWFTDVMQDYVNLQLQLNEAKAEFKKLQLTNQQLLEANKKLTQEKKGDGSKS